MDKIRVVNQLKENRVAFLKKTITQKMQKIINQSMCNEKTA